MKLLKNSYKSKTHFGYNFWVDFLIVNRYNYFNNPVFWKYPIRHIEFESGRTVNRAILKRCQEEFKNHVLST